ncbi:MAG TPA: tetratricopeptide repeat protein, partial [Labilithrix sp.]
IDSCDQAKDDDKEAPDGCRVPLRIHLRALSKDEKEGEEAENKATQNASKSDGDDKPKLTEKPCPEGTVRTEGGACVPPSDKIRFQCRPDVDECKTQCDKGHLGSCEKLGFMLLWPPFKDGKPVTDRDPKGAIAALQKACDITKKDGEVHGCVTLASAYRYATLMPAPGTPPPSDNDKKTAYDKGVAVLDYACKRGDKAACSSLGFQYEYGQTPIVQPDVDRAVHFYKRACEIGYEFACLSAARLYMDGKKDRDGKEIFHREPDQALTLLDQRCKESSSLACSQLASYLTTDKYKVKDLKRAAGIFQLLCDRKNNTGCAENALLQVSGTGKPDPKVDLKQARTTLESLCFDTNNSSACYGVALLKETGRGGTPEDKSKALDYYKKYSYVKDAAARAAHLLEAGGHGVTKDLTAAESYYRQACLGFNNSDAALCMHAANLAEKATPGSGRYYFAAACRLGDKVGCAKEKAATAAAQKPHPPTGPVSKK